MKIKSSAKGFTLIELLVVVLIIGILSAVALPMYRKAVEKSRVADALNTMQAVAKSEHGWYLTNNSYTKDFSNLDIDLIDENGEKADGESYDTVNYTFTLQDNSIMAERNNNEYTLFKLYEDGNIYCSPQDHYVCQQYDWAMNKRACDNLGAAWSNWKNTCFSTEGERCVAHEMTYNEDTGLCGCTGWDGSCSGLTINEGGQCLANRIDGCRNLMINAGGQCKGGGQRACNNSTITAGGECEGVSNRTCQELDVTAGLCNGLGGLTCQSSTFTAGSTCTGLGGSACAYSTFTARSVCDTTGTQSGGGCSSSTFVDSACIGTMGRACQAGNFTNSTCTGDGDYGCSSSTFSSSTCYGNKGIACGASTFEEGSVCIGKADGSCGSGYPSGNSTYKTGSKCIGYGWTSCSSSTFEEGTVCEGYGTSCGVYGKPSTFKSGSKCIANTTTACTHGTLESGSRCIANVEGSCKSTAMTYQSGSCCENKEGTNNCPANVPKCHCPNGDGTYATSC